MANAVAVISKISTKKMWFILSILVLIEVFFYAIKHVLKMSACDDGIRMYKSIRSEWAVYNGGV